MHNLKAFLDELVQKLNNKTFVKITLSKPSDNKSALLNIYIRQVVLKEQTTLSFTYHYKTNDQTKNYTTNESILLLNELIGKQFKVATLFSLDEDLTLQYSKKGISGIRKSLPSFSSVPSTQHDKQKVSRLTHEKYLTLLGITDEKGNVIPKMADKYKQINKYLEIVEGLISKISHQNTIKIVDMGSGKGYLTFALYNFLTHQKRINVSVTGVESRQELVDFCNTTAQKCGFTQLNFIHSTIQQYKPTNIDVLIALHACDTATDDAIFAGIKNSASLIITAPCCHKQIRQQLKGTPPKNPILKYGIFKERQYEMVTDTIRALILENYQYNAHVFEFISNEHTRKNVMLVGIKSNKLPDNPSIQAKIDELKHSFDVQQHYLESLFV